MRGKEFQLAVHQNPLPFPKLRQLYRTCGKDFQVFQPIQCHNLFHWAFLFKLLHSPTLKYWQLSLLGSNKEASAVDGRYTPTPRRSIHSYKVTETSKETITKGKDGVISRDYDYKKTTATSHGEIGAVGRFLRFLPSMFLLLIIAAVGYYIYVVRNNWIR